MYNISICCSFRFPCPHLSDFGLLSTANVHISAVAASPEMHLSENPNWMDTDVSKRTTKEFDRSVDMFSSDSDGEEDKLTEGLLFEWPYVMKLTI